MNNLDHRGVGYGIVDLVSMPASRQYSFRFQKVQLLGSIGLSRFQAPAKVGHRSFSTFEYVDDLKVHRVSDCLKHFGGFLQSARLDGTLRNLLHTPNLFSKDIPYYDPEEERRTLLVQHGSNHFILRVVSANFHEP